MPYLLLIPQGAGCVEESRRPPSFPRNLATDLATNHKGETTNMKISCLKEDLAHGLGVVSHALPTTRVLMHITQNVLLSAKDSKLKLSSTNLEMFITTSIPAVIQEEGEITVPARLLIELVNSLPNERVDLDLPEGSGFLHLTCAQIKAHINSTLAKEFSLIPDIDESQDVLINSQELRTAIARTAFAVARTEQSRPVLTGVEMKLSGSKFSMSATDGFRLAVHRGQLAHQVLGVVPPLTAIIPAQTLTHLSRLLGNRLYRLLGDRLLEKQDAQQDELEELVEIAISTANRYAVFRMQNTQVISHLIQGDFPSYDELIPQKHETRTIFDSRELLRVTRTAAIFAKGGSNIIRLEIEPEYPDGHDQPDTMPATAIISAKSEEHGDNKDEITPESVEGDAVKIAFNSTFLQEALTALSPGKVALETTNSTSPGVLKFPGSEEYVMILMPMFVWT